MSDRAKKIIANAALFAGFFVVAFVAAELLVRAFFKDEISLFPRYHSAVQYGEFRLRRIRPNTTFWHTSPDGSWRFDTNAQGFRNTENFDYAKPGGVIRVLSIGDSHTQGYEVSQDATFSTVIERYLEKNGHEVQVLNAGVSGFSTAEELVFLENEGIKFDPDFVVLGFYANDFEDNIKAGLFQLGTDGTLSIAKQAHVPGVRAQDLVNAVPMTEWLGENSYFYSMLFNGVYQFFKTRLADDANEAVAEYAVPTKTEVSSYESALTVALLERMYEFCRLRGIPLVILDVPRLSSETSMPPELKARIAELSDAYIDSGELLSTYYRVTRLHRPHGSQHITDFSHLILGVAAARQIDSWLSVSESAEQ